MSPMTHTRRSLDLAHRRRPATSSSAIRTSEPIGQRTAGDLLAALRKLDASDPHWVVAGTAGVKRTGQHVRQLFDPSGGPTDDPLPVPVVTLDENFLVFNGRAHPRCSPRLHGFHLYGTDVCLYALSSGGSAYVIDFPVTHLSSGHRDADFLQARARLTEVWSRRLNFCYVISHTGVIFLSRSRALRKWFGSELMLRYVDTISRNRALLVHPPELRLVFALTARTRHLAPERPWIHR